ncbi:MAG: DUF4197 domain-containing protein [Deltaproteobacteria bacterium]|jgi:hypothetical protein|nr:DUF4197 domain-containing protein [Deltaproteobacteria bacterium]
MKNRIYIVIGSIFFLLVFNLYDGHAGFQDILNDAKKIFSSDDGLTESEIIEGLKEALEIGSAEAVQAVSGVDGYYKNPDIRIPLPEDVQKAEKYMRMAGFGDKVDEFELSMNRAAERAAPQAKSIFREAITQMTFDDAREILNGADNSATLYFEEKTSAQLGEVFKPIVGQSMQQVGVTSTYKDLNQRAQSIPFVESFSFDLDQYVTDKALNGLFVMLAAEEKKIREDPAARVTDLLKKVFANQ